MLRSLTIIFFTIFSTSIYSQSNNVEPTNNTVVRLTIVNGKGEILIRETKYGWMTPSVYYNKRQNLNELIDSLANSYGIEISSPNLGGVFTYKYEFKKTSDIRLLYIANFEGGELKSEFEDENLYWMKKAEGIDKLKTTVSSLGEMTNQILDYPQIVWGGSFMLYRNEEKKLFSQITESFYPLTGN